MKVKLIRIGNSLAVRLPKAVIARAGLGNEVEISVRGNEVVISSIGAGPRHGWNKAFRNAIAAKGREQPDVQRQSMANRFDAEEWTW